MTGLAGGSRSQRPDARRCLELLLGAGADPQGLGDAGTPAPPDASHCPPARCMSDG